MTIDQDSNKYKLIISCSYNWIASWLYGMYFETLIGKISEQISSGRFFFSSHVQIEFNIEYQIIVFLRCSYRIFEKFEFR